MRYCKAQQVAPADRQSAGASLGVLSAAELSRYVFLKNIK